MDVLPLQRVAIVFAAFGLLAAGPARSQAALANPSPVAVPAAPLPGNKVQCVYDYMSLEDREMALLLLAREIADGGRFRKSSPNVQAVDRLIEEAHAQCLARFKWSVIRSDAATGYALAAILAEALGQAIDSFGYPLAPLDGYLADNRARLAGRSVLGPSDREQLNALLKSNGWDKASEDELALARLYLETRLLQAQADRRFGLASGPIRQPIRKPKGRAATAKRGKP